MSHYFSAFAEIPVLWWWVSFFLTGLGVVFAGLRWWQARQARKIAALVKKEMKEAKEEMRETRDEIKRERQ